MVNFSLNVNDSNFHASYFRLMVILGHLNGYLNGYILY